MHKLGRVFSHQLRAERVRHLLRDNLDENGGNRVLKRQPVAQA
jgi:hypothetical protein